MSNSPTPADAASAAAGAPELKPRDNNLRLGLGLGFIGVVIFGMTLPITRLAVLELDPLFVTLARALIAAMMAVACLALTRAAPPPRDTWPSLFVFGSCVALGYPLLMGTAMKYAPASHGGVVLAVQPLLTALASMWVAGERPSPQFWACSLAGTAAAIAYAVMSSAGALELHWADLLLAAAAAVGCFGYAIGGHLTQRMPGWHVISWALTLMLPLLIVLLLASGVPDLGRISSVAWASLVFLGMFPMYLGFFAWNRALAIGGIAKVGQVQLVQPFITLAAASLLLGEVIGWMEIVFSVLVVGLVALGSRMRVTRQG